MSVYHLYIFQLLQRPCFLNDVFTCLAVSISARVCSHRCSLRVCLVDADKGVRCQVLRLIRYFLAADDAHRKSAARASDLIGHSSSTVAAPNTLSLACELERYNFGVFLSRSLERDGKHMWERMQVGDWQCSTRQ